MTVDTVAIEDALLDALPADSYVSVSTRADHPEDDHYQVTAVSPAFEGKALVQQHQRVHTIVQDAFGDAVHALEVKTFTPDEHNADS